jgi:hypothetical protein
MLAHWITEQAKPVATPVKGRSLQPSNPVRRKRYATEQSRR